MNSYTILKIHYEDIFIYNEDILKDNIKAEGNIESNNTLNNYQITIKNTNYDSSINYYNISKLYDLCI